MAQPPPVTIAPLGQVAVSCVKSFGVAERCSEIEVLVPFVFAKQVAVTVSDLAAVWVFVAEMRQPFPSIKDCQTRTPA